MTEEAPESNNCPPHTPLMGGTAAYKWSSGSGPESGHWQLVENRCAKGYSPQAPAAPGSGTECRRTQCIVTKVEPS